MILLLQITFFVFLKQKINKNGYPFPIFGTTFFHSYNSNGFPAHDNRTRTLILQVLLNDDLYQLLDSLQCTTTTFCWWKGSCLYLASMLWASDFCCYSQYLFLDFFCMFQTSLYYFVVSINMERAIDFLLLLTIISFIIYLT